MNSVNIIGHLTRDIEVRYLPSGMAVADGAIAVNDRIKRGSEYVDEPSFFDLTLFGRTAEIAAEYAGKGSKVGISGKLKQDTWADKATGEKRSKVKIVVDRLDLLGDRRARDDEAPEVESDEIPF